jgi:cell volume regulation protein A
VPDTTTFATALLLTAVAALGAIFSARVAERTRIPSPALVLLGTAAVVKVVPDLHPPSVRVVDRVVTAALVVILFDGGMQLGWSRVRSAAGAIASAGVAGTVATTAGAAVVVRLATGLPWYLCLLTATAVAPTDPAVVFSVLGSREIEGRASTILEGEAGANDPVGIALLASLLSAGALTGSTLGSVAGGFLQQMAVGLAVGVAGGWALLWTTRRVRLPAAGLYPLRTLAVALLLYGAAAVAHGSGFIAVFAAGVVLGDASAPFKPDIARFHDALAGLGELVAFVALGLVVDLTTLARADVWVPGVLLWLALTVLVRPVALGLSLLPVRMGREQRAFVLFAGLKGAVPILLGTSLLAAQVAHAERLFGIVVVVVVLSVVVQGGLVPTVARVLHLPMRLIEPEPWVVGVRLQERPEGVHRLTVAPGAPADGARIAELSGLPAGSWLSLVVRNGSLVAARGDTTLEAGDEVVVLAGRGELLRLLAVFAPAELD